MKKNILLIVLTIAYFGTFAQFPSYVTEIKSKPNATVSVNGNLALGKEINDLSWAWNSSVACFPETQKNKFTGYHVLYSTQLPKRAIMTITVIPTNKNQNFSLYAYSIGTTYNSLVPDLPSCVSCEADHKWDYKKAGRTQDHTRSVSLNAINNPYNVVIGVVGADGLRSAGFRLEIKIEGGEDETNKIQEPVKVSTIASEKNKTVETKGNLSQGVKINDLSWAWNSSVACFPETQKKKFTGNHVLYTTEIPKYSTMEITVVPDNPKDDFSIYAYEIGLTNNSIVPNLPSCVSCEAEHKWDYPKKGRTQDHTRTVSNLTAINNPYKVVIGVVGANGLIEGGFTLKIKTVSR